MATVNAGNSDGLDLDSITLTDFSQATVESSTPTQFSLEYQGGVTDIFFGENFGYNDNGLPVSGDITFFQQTGASGQNFTAFNFDVPVATFAHWASIADAADALASILSGPDVIFGSPFADYLKGYDGADTLDGAGGADTLAGGAGDDTYFVRDLATHVVEAPGQGFDVVLSSVSYALDPGQEIESLAVSDQSSTAPLNLFGNTSTLFISGDNGDNVLGDGGGVVTMYGFIGDDTYWVGDPGDKVIELPGQGYDTVFAWSNFTLTPGSEIEKLQAASTAPAGLILSGNEFSQTIIGGNGGNALFGGDGDDHVVGGAGNDLIGGNAGADTLHGGSGSDTFVYFAAADSPLSAPDVIDDFFPGADRIDLSAIDADTTQAGQQHFNFVGIQHGPQPAGTLDLDYIQGVGIFLFGYTNASGAPTFAINVGNFDIHASDLVL